MPNKRQNTGREAVPTSCRSRLPALSFASDLILYPHEIKCIPLNDERIAFGMLEALDFEVYIKVGPLDGFGAAHLDVEHAADGRILHPRDAVVRQEVVVTQHGEHDALRVNHQYACRCAGGIVL